MPSLSDTQVLHPRPGAVVVECVGEHDYASKDELGRLLTELVMENELVVVDVSGAEFIDSSFLHNLAIADRLARQRGTVFRLQHSTAPIVHSALEYSGLLHRLDHAKTREDALAPAREQVRIGGTP